jgi:hypothetical protein
MTTRSEQANALWPHLAGDRPAPRETPRSTSPLASAMYPKLASLAPKPQPSISPEGRITFGYEVVPGLRRKGR